MEKNDLESLIGNAKTFIRQHKTSCFLAGSLLYAGNVYLGYYRVSKDIQSGNYKEATINYGLSNAFSIPGTILLGFSSFYIAKQILGRKNAAKTFRHLSNISPYAKRAKKSK